MRVPAVEGCPPFGPKPLRPRRQPSRGESLNTTIIGFITHAARSFAAFLGLAFVLSARAAPQHPIDQQLSRILEQIQSGDLRDARAGLTQALAQSPGDPRILN